MRFKLRSTAVSRVALHLTPATRCWTRKGSGFDTANSSLGGTAYNQFHPENDFARDAFVSRHRFVSYGTIDLPFGKGRKYGKDASRWLKVLSAAGNSPGTCMPRAALASRRSRIAAIAIRFSRAISPATRSMPWADLQTTCHIGRSWSGVQILLSEREMATLTPRLSLRRRLGPTCSTIQMSSGVTPCLDQARGEPTLVCESDSALPNRTRLEIGADFNNVFNHPLLSPTDPDAAFEFTHIGTFFVDVNPTTRKLQPITRVEPNTNFGLLNRSFTDEGIDNRRTVRLRLRFTF